LIYILYFQILPKDIGIISPYRRQVQKLRDLMNRKFQNKIPNWRDVTVGSTEEFQGQVGSFQSVLLGRIRIPRAIIQKLAISVIKIRKAERKG
jgi:hypothetical protein